MAAEVKSWPLQLVDLGYDVWLGNARGTRHSAEKFADSDSDFDYWNFTISDMATYDQPANIGKIREVTGQDKVTYIGYSLGSSIMFYGLAKMHDYYAEHLNRFIALAPLIELNNLSYEEF